MSNYLTTNALKNLTAISANVDVSLLENFIPISESMSIDPILGLALSTEIRTQIDADTISAANQNLLDNYILPASAWSTFLEASTFLFMRTEAKGITKKYSDNSQAIDIKEFSLYKQSIMDKKTFYCSRLIDFLELNKTSYPLYRSDDRDKPRKSNSSGIFLG